MKTKACLALALAAGCALATTANAQQQVGRYHKAKPMTGRVTYNVATGEMSVQKFNRKSRPIASPENIDPSVWNNTDYAGNGLWYFTAYPGEEVMDWGDIGTTGSGDSVNVTCFDFAYCSSSAGLIDLEIAFYEPEEGFGTGPGTFAQVDGGGGDAYFGFVGVPGGTGGVLQCWILTVDFGGQGFPFTFDADSDADGDMDFGWSMFVTGGDPAATTGPYLTLPAFDDIGNPWSTLAGVNSFGVADAFDSWSGAHTGYQGTFFFGGAAPPAIPFTSFYANFYGTIGGGPAECYADCEKDKDLDVFDFLCYQNEHSNMTAYGDCEKDNDWDVFDFLCFQGEYANGCIF